jgi:hypothetical protein
MDSDGTAKNALSAKLSTERRNQIDMALLRQSLKRGDYDMWWVPSRENLSDPLIKESLSGPSPLPPSMVIKKSLFDALRQKTTS